jgi:hypothetical protein
LAACINQQLEEGGYFLGNQQTLKLLLRGVWSYTFSLPNILKRRYISSITPRRLRLFIVAAEFCWQKSDGRTRNGQRLRDFNMDISFLIFLMSVLNYESDSVFCLVYLHWH